LGGGIYESGQAAGIAQGRAKRRKPVGAQGFCGLTIAAKLTDWSGNPASLPRQAEELEQWNASAFHTPIFCGVMRRKKCAQI
jgi:hypothetical protein